MLVKDEAKQVNWRQALAAERQRELRRQQLADDILNSEITVKPDAGRDITEPASRMGRMMTPQKVMEKLRLCNTKLHFEVSNSDPTKLGVYLLTDEGDLRTLPSGETIRTKFICGMENRPMPEMTIVIKATKKVPNPVLIDAMGSGKRVDRDAVKWKEIETYKDHIPGWRTVLVRLLHAGLIGRYDVERHFGWTPSMPSERWYNLTK